MKGMLTFSPQFVVNPSPEPEVTEPFWDPWFSDEERSDEVTEEQLEDWDRGNRLIGDPFDVLGD